MILLRFRILIMDYGLSWLKRDHHGSENLINRLALSEKMADSDYLKMI
jgi:hypothetical protein